MTAAASIARLRAIAARLIEREDADAAWFAAALQEYTAGAPHGLTLGDAFGLRLEPGERPWWQLDAIERRDELLRRIASTYFPGLAGRSAAAAILTALARYEATGWRRDRAYVTPPAALRGDLFRLLRLAAPLSESTIRRALAGSRDGSIREPRAPAA